MEDVLPNSWSARLTPGANTDDANGLQTGYQCQSPEWLQHISLSYLMNVMMLTVANWNHFRDDG